MDLGLSVLLLGLYSWLRSPGADAPRRTIERGGISIDARVYEPIFGFVFILPSGLLLAFAALGYWLNRDWAPSVQRVAIAWAVACVGVVAYVMLGSVMR